MFLIQRSTVGLIVGQLFRGRDQTSSGSVSSRGWLYKGSPSLISMYCKSAEFFLYHERLRFELGTLPRKEYMKYIQHYIMMLYVILF